jgi:hypothetical protein
MKVFEVSSLNLTESLCDELACFVMAIVGHVFYPVTFFCIGQIQIFHIKKIS